MAIISTPIQAGSPVTAELINNIITDINTISASTKPDFILTLDATGKDVSGAQISQKVYSEPIPVTLEKNKIGKGKWDFVKSNIKFTSPPRCWIQVNNSDSSLTVGKFDFTIVVTSVTTKALLFDIRGPFESTKHTFMCFAADA